MAQRLCKYCKAQLQPSAEVCAHCGNYQYAVQVETPLRPIQRSSPLQPPTGLGSYALQPGQGQQQVIYLQPIVAPPGMRYTSSFALLSMILGILAIILTAFDTLFNVNAAFSYTWGPTPFIIIVTFALVCWGPALIALIFGLAAKSKIRRSNGQVHGLGLADTGIILGSLSLVLPLLGVLFFSLALFP